MPSDNYRVIPIIPELHELIGSTDPNIRSNVINGKYLSAYHYLDIHFRLLREDFIAPLRNGIKNLFETGHRNGKLNTNLRVYYNVQIVSTTIVQQKQFCFVVKLNLQYRKYIKELEYLKSGSLVIFSKDSFKTIFTGIVVHSDKDTLENGNIYVDIQWNSMNYRDYYELKCVSTNYTMVEPNVYFEPYRHVLAALQGITEQSFPMSKYILNADFTSKQPGYLQKVCSIITNGRYFRIWDWRQWELIKPEDLNYDITQFEAFKAALMNEFCIIQGPPGTGKTFIGLEIIKTLLENTKVYDVQTRITRMYYGPILIVCYTNHALDQFLEGVLKFTKSVARIGGQSKSDKLHEYNIRELRRNDMKTKNYGQLLFQIRKVIDELHSIVQMIQFKDTVLFDVRHLLGERNVYFETIGEFKRWILFRKAQYANIDYLSDVNSYFGSKHFKDIRSFLEDFKHENISGIKLHENEKKDLEIYLKKNLNQFPLPLIVTNSYQLGWKERWALYWNCLVEIQLDVINRIKKLEKDYTTIEQERDLEVLRGRSVVGLTTTGAAKNRILLEKLRSPIVFVEEAAEVLESHILTSLTSYCEHLILIGDHKQLRPSTSEYRMAKDFNLDVSLFERMILNGMPCATLGVQHRMRAEFAQLIVPSIYPNLQNHPSVLKYPQIMGLTKNLFFIKHTQFENDVANTTSKINNHEAQFILQLCHHLILQGYGAKDITILATYGGQVEHMKRLQNNYRTIQDVRISTVDGFQGEESNIILLSLVRSNIKRQIGFLAIENRVCVALSRARHGFYIIGNMDQLVRRTNSLWPRINEVLIKNNSIGTDLVLQCKIHNDQQTNVNCANDFKEKCPEGGCLLPCNFIKKCGHYCERKCHVQVGDHTNKNCSRQCLTVIWRKDNNYMPPYNNIYATPVQSGWKCQIL